MKASKAELALVLNQPARHADVWGRGGTVCFPVTSSSRMGYREW
jgi:hypothetical protein